MPYKRSWNTKLTSVEVRWIRNSYKPMKDRNPHTGVGAKKLADKINEGRKKTKLGPVSKTTVNRVIQKINEGVPINPIDGAANKMVVCPYCGNSWVNKGV